MHKQGWLSVNAESTRHAAVFTYITPSIYQLATVHLCNWWWGLSSPPTVCHLFLKFIIRRVSLILQPVFVTHRLHNVQVVLAFYAVSMLLQPAQITNACWSTNAILHTLPLLLLFIKLCFNKQHSYISKMTYKLSKLHQTDIAFSS